MNNDNNDDNIIFVQVKLVQQQYAVVNQGLVKEIHKLQEKIAIHIKKVKS